MLEPLKCRQPAVRSCSLAHLHLRSMCRGRDAGTRGGRCCQWVPHSWQVLHGPPGSWDIRRHSRVQALNMARRRREGVAGASPLTRVGQGTEIKREGAGVFDPPPQRQFCLGRVGLGPGPGQARVRRDPWGPEQQKAHGNAVHQSLAIPRHWALWTHARLNRRQLGAWPPSIGVVACTRSSSTVARDLERVAAQQPRPGSYGHHPSAVMRAASQVVPRISGGPGAPKEKPPSRGQRAPSQGPK